MIDDNFLQESLKFQLLYGIGLTFDYICGRDYYSDNSDNDESCLKCEEQNNNNDYTKLEKNYSKSTKKNIIDDDNQIVYDEKKYIDANVNNKDNDIQNNNSIDLRNISTFNDLIEAIKTFNGCDLKFCAKNSVIFDGNMEAKIMLIGEAPGENEDEKGIPFCGQSGKLLRKALSFIDLNTDNMIITNTVYWRPPMNRKPSENELSICFPFVKKMIEIVKPNMVILCGSTAIKLFLKSNEKMEKITGKAKRIGVKNNNYFVLNNEEEIDNINCDYSFSTFSIYHPSYLLRNPSMKKVFWKHVLKLKQEIDAMF